MRILVLGYIVRSALGGMSWHYLHYLAGLQRLGHDVSYMEDSGDDVRCCYHPSTDDFDEDPAEGLRLASSVLERLGSHVNWAYYDAHRDRWHGNAADQALAVFASADALINISGSNALRPWSDVVPLRIMIDTDPALHQIRNLQEPYRRALSLRHTHFFTFGENIGRRGCRIPDDGFSYLGTRQPLVLDLWPEQPPRASGKFTSILNWESYEAREHDGARFGMKSASFAPFVGLSRLTAAKIELALGGPAPRDELRSEGWRLRDPLSISRDPWQYQRYVGRSKAEFAIAKEAYVVSRSGWFSERTAAYLASGRPVVVQDTGFGEWMRPNRAVRAFSTPADARAALDDMERAYEPAQREARAVAEEYFDHRDVLGRLLDALD